MQLCPLLGHTKDRRHTTLICIHPSHPYAPPHPQHPPQLTLETAREFSKALSVRASLALTESGSPELKLASSRRLSPTLSGTVDLAAALNGDEDQEALGFALTSATGKTELTGKVRIAGEELSLRGSYENRCERASGLDRR